tara:strand:- start:5464 stop:5664 length:201 start_codon:yes stop_codon:yes gene_type:complete
MEREGLQALQGHRALKEILGHRALKEILGHRDLLGRKAPRAHRVLMPTFLPLVFLIFPTQSNLEAL